MLFPDHMLAVFATVPSEREAEFNHWYETEHVPDVLRAFPACVGAARYRVVQGDGSHQYVAMYAFPDAATLEAAMAGEALKGLIRLYDEAIGSFSTRRRVTYRRVFRMEP